MKVVVDFAGIYKLSDKTVNFKRTVPFVVEEYKHRKLEELLREVIRRASGRPGPNIVTGHYVGSFYIYNNEEVRNSSPQTHRLEYGFVGTDSLGRIYNQPPFPHFRPALEFVRKGYVDGMVAEIRAAWRAA